LTWDFLGAAKQPNSCPQRDQSLNSQRLRADVFLNRHLSRRTWKVKLRATLIATALLVGGGRAAEAGGSSASPDVDDTMTKAMPLIEKGCKVFGSAAIMTSGNDVEPFSDFLDIAEEEFAAALAVDSQFRGVHDALGLIGDRQVGTQSIGIVSEFCTGMNESSAFD